MMNAENTASLSASVALFHVSFIDSHVRRTICQNIHPRREQSAPFVRKDRVKHGGPKGKGRKQSDLLSMQVINHAMLRRERERPTTAPKSRTKPLTVLLATDGSPHAQAAAHGLAALQLPPESQVVVLAVAPLLHVAHRADLYLALWEREAREIHAALCRMLTTLKKAGVQVKPMLHRGRPSDLIVGTAEEIGVDLIAIGATANTMVKGGLTLVLSAPSLRRYTLPALGVLTLTSMGLAARI